MQLMCVAYGGKLHQHLPDVYHQGCADPGGLVATGWCPEDDLVEVVEDPRRSFAVGVQWHPEDTTDLRLFEAFVAASAQRPQRRHRAPATPS